ncbi:hypothetical protein GW17_00039184 [Ensete ventricosum]|nr:hypothetical protein GW17_00039184 [Ensete ventricosum]
MMKGADTVVVEERLLRKEKQALTMGAKEEGKSNGDDGGETTAVDCETRWQQVLERAIAVEL